jgi:hypothetical protein
LASYDVRAEFTVDAVITTAHISLQLCTMHFPGLATSTLLFLTGRSPSPSTSNAGAHLAPRASALQPWIITSLWTGSPSKGTSYYTISFSISDPNTISAGASTPRRVDTGYHPAFFPPSNASCRIDWAYEDPPLGKTFNCSSDVDSAHWTFQVLNGSTDEVASGLPADFLLRVMLNDSMVLGKGKGEVSKAYVAQKYFQEGLNLNAGCGAPGSCTWLLNGSEVLMNQTLVE